MSWFLGALGGIGEAGVQIGLQNQKDWAAQDLAKQRDDAESERQKSLVRLRMELEQQQKDAPLARLGEKSKEFSKQEVPVQAEVVKALIGPMSDGQGGERIGMKGDIESLKKRAESLPEADRQPYLDQLKSQQAQDQAKAQDAVAGQTRKLTGEESLEKAVEWARANDLPAVAAYEAQIGRPMREERRVDNQERRDDSRIKAEADRTALLDRKFDSQEAAATRREERQDKFMELQEKRLTAAGDKAELQSQRASITALMTSTEREVERTMALVKDPMLSEADKKMFQDRVVSLQKDLGRYRKGLEGFGGEAVPTATEPTKQAPFPPGTVKDGFVYKGGDVNNKSSWEKAEKPASATKPMIEKRQNEPAYAPPANSRAAQALEERANAKKEADRKAEEQMMEDARQRIAKREEEARRAEAFKKANNL